MIFSKLRRVSLILVLVAILLSSNHVMHSQGEPLAMMHRRFNLLSHSDEATRATVTRGTISPDGTGNGAAGGGGVLGEDTRATDPGHSPGAGHAATNNGVGRKLLGVN
ncbi:hypothetical protein GQ55_9G451800 [Panicum hallii var. hallii]|jgi:hypothetical protein|uniref:Uncharacterized protein n=2 Tax=Panicum hallii TaxID=206008 RepID=A0A2T7CBT3_9POAL|nr:hypothetical protein PAHAL_9G439900 [Panicum hallii]PUZ40796.1 hypothetical protein GQ55_9G451800 [Panicum hallii var. hallii]